MPVRSTLQAEAIRWFPVDRQLWPKDGLQMGAIQPEILGNLCRNWLCLANNLFCAKRTVPSVCAKCMRSGLQALFQPLAPCHAGNTGSIPLYINKYINYLAGLLATNSWFKQPHNQLRIASSYSVSAKAAQFVVNFVPERNLSLNRYTKT